VTVQRVVYVSATGRPQEGRLLSGEEYDGRYQVLISEGGLACLTVVRARHSERREPGTWHRPPKPN